MAITKEFGKGRLVEHPNDKVYTPEKIAKEIIELFPIENCSILDPFRGGGAFYNNYPTTCKKDWCELDEGKDFFEYTNKVDWIISNPPYSILEDVLTHSFEIADNIVYLVPLSKVVSSMGRIRQIDEFGGVPLIYIIGASRCGFPFGFPACAIHIKKDYIGDTKILVS